MINTVAYFGHDVSDAAIKRRVGAFRGDGLNVIGFMKRRSDTAQADWQNVDLGRTHDGALLARIVSIFTGVFRTWKARKQLKTADAIVARNLDMLACAVMARGVSGSSAPIVYECLDVHRLMCRQDIVGGTLRKIEAWLMTRVSGLMVSSPAFLSEYFEKYHADAYRSRLVENRLVPEMLAALHGKDGARDVPTADNDTAIKKLRLGWVGILRCSRSLDILCQLAAQYPDHLQIDLHGIPSGVEVPDFEDRIAPYQNIVFHGRYRSPEDLDHIYGNMDLVWSIDFMEAGYNSLWLLPNRIYEGGYFSVPSVAVDGTETARWVAEREGGFVLQEPLLESASDLVQKLLATPDLIGKKRAALSALDRSAFVQPSGFIKQTMLELVA